MTWETVPLGEVSWLNPRGDSSIEPGTFLGMADVSENGTTTTGTGVEPGDLKAGYTPFRDRDLLVAKITPCFENGKIAQASLPTKLGWGSTEFHVVRPNAELLHDRYALHYLRTPSVRANGTIRMTGSAGQRRVPLSYLQSLEIPLPPLPEQRRIAAILDEADALRVKRAVSLEKLADAADALFAMQASEEWALTTVDTVADLQGGLTINGRRQQLEQQVGYLRVANVMRGRVDFDEVKTLGVTAAEVNRTALKPDDVVVVEGHGNLDEVGRAARIPDIGTTVLTHQNHLFRLRPRASVITGTFLERAMNSATSREHLRRVANTTSGLNTLNATSVRSTPIRVPPISVQESLDRDLGRVDEQLARAQRSHSGLESLFASLQHRAFRGEL
ncbi:restriction endonuclease subunit S [Microbacterium chocolatum]|uniref:restriction endonuclease subunit S n=1 Tax=Microbacterium aurantiacum TaxID=162393 RepID=UPI00339074DD